MQSENLKPCPFCGGEADRVDIEDGENAGGSFVHCTVCDASGNIEFEFKENFISNWNRRVEAALSAAEPSGEIAGQQGRYWITAEGRWSNWFDITFNTWVPEPGVREVRNLYAAPPAPSVAVKALEWVEGPPGTYTEIAESPFGHYSVWEINGTACWSPWKQGYGSIAEGGLAGAKAAAQADYEARIRSALSAQVQDVAGWQLVPTELTPQMVQHLQMNTEMGAYVCENLSGAYSLMDEYHRAMLASAPAKQEG